MKFPPSLLPSFTLDVYNSQNESIFMYWVEVNPMLARSSCPRFIQGQGDKTQNLTEDCANYLQSHHITQIISLNHCRLSEDQQKLLSDRHIQYHNFPVEDYFPIELVPTKAAVELMKRNHKTLVWCGMGIGRTGQLITAWEISSGKVCKKTAIANSTAEKDPQEMVLWQIPEPSLFDFCMEIAKALKDYKLSMTQGSFSTFFGVRNATQPSKDILQFLSLVLAEFEINIDTVHAGDDLRNRLNLKACELVPLSNHKYKSKLDLESFMSVVEFFAGINNDRCEIFGILHQVKGVNCPTAQAGLTMKVKLKLALERFHQKFPISRSLMSRVDPRMYS
ncbi:MAG: hypothetical protein NT172_06065 [Planctomycetota bacterium]|nr:hypothetical protein [Planctomycetota bacterium]